MAGSGYRTYRGRRTGKSFKGFFIVLLIFAALVILFLYLDTFLSLPEEEQVHNGASDSSAATPIPTDDIVIVVVTPGQQEVSASPSVSPGQETPDYLKCAFLRDPADMTQLAGIMQLAKQGIINAVIVNVRGDDGLLKFVSKSTLAINGKANPQSDAVSGAVAQLKAEGLYVIAEMSAFRDDTVPRAVQKAAVKLNSGIVWLDMVYNAWLNPYEESAREYIKELSLELIDLGCDEVLLSNFCFPTQGRPELIYYEEEATTPKTEVLNAFTDELERAIVGAGGKLSLRLSATKLTDGKIPAAGLDCEYLYAAVDRIYATFEHGKLYNGTRNLLLADAGYGDITGSFVAVIPSNGDTSDEPDKIEADISDISPDFGGWAVESASGLYPAFSE